MIVEWKKGWLWWANDTYNMIMIAAILPPHQMIAVILPPQSFYTHTHTLSNKQTHTHINT